MAQTSKPFMQQLREVRLNMLCYENAELKDLWCVPSML